MIWTVTLNPAIDCSSEADIFETGAVNRGTACEYRPGGKGINVSLLLHSLGMDTTALGVAAGFTGKELLRLLEEECCPADFLLLEQGFTRINLKIRDGARKETELNGAGPQVPLSALDGLAEKLAAARPGDGLVLAGSVPASLPKDSYARILEGVREKDLLTVVDAAGEALLAALSCRPFLIKPNLQELSEVSGMEIPDALTAVDCARALQDRGARNVAVSMGERGALLVREDGRAMFCASARGETESTVGAGDSLVAGFLYGWKLHGTLDGALRWGVCAGAATAFSRGIATGEQVKAAYLKVGNPHFL